MNESKRKTAIEKPTSQFKPIAGKSIKPSAGDKQRGFSVVELLFAAATLSATVVATAMTNPKIPKTAGD